MHEITSIELVLSNTDLLLEIAKYHPETLKNMINTVPGLYLWNSSNDDLRKVKACSGTVTITENGQSYTYSILDSRVVSDGNGSWDVLGKNPSLITVKIGDKQNSYRYYKEPGGTVIKASSNISKVRRKLFV